MEQPSVGTHYPRSTGEFQAWFRTDADCLDYLDWVRWPGGFTCPSCGHAGGWQLGDGRRECAGCHGRTSVTAGTIFDRTRTPLTVWFTACWLFATQKDGISAQSLQRSLEIGSYPTAWAMLHRLRSVLVRPGRDRLSGTVEVDETFIGGQEPGLRGTPVKYGDPICPLSCRFMLPRVIRGATLSVIMGVAWLRTEGENSRKTVVGVQRQTTEASVVGEAAQLCMRIRCIGQIDQSPQ